MITDVSASIVTEMMGVMRAHFKYVSLLEYAPTTMTAHVECKARRYARQPITWRVESAGLMVNDAPLRFTGLESPVVFYGVGLHNTNVGSALLGWGAFGMPPRIYDTDLLIRAGALSVRLT